MIRFEEVGEQGFVSSYYCIDQVIFYFAVSKLGELENFVSVESFCIFVKRNVKTFSLKIFILYYTSSVL